MRKAAGLKRGSRKKQQEETGKGPSQDSAASVSSNSTNGERRKPSNDEAALTSKNYRLAKELVRMTALFFIVHKRTGSHCYA